MKKPFFGLTKPKMTYSGIDDTGQNIQEIPPPNRIVLSSEAATGLPPDVSLSTGQEVRTGQRLRPLSGAGGYLTATATGVISDVSATTEGEERTRVSVSIDKGPKEVWDPEFENGRLSPESENVLSYFSLLPGISDLVPLITKEKPLETLLVSGFDQDLLVATRQLSLKNGADHLSQGIDALKKMTGASQVLIAVPTSLRPEAETGGVEVRTMDPVYPYAAPGFLLRSLLGIAVPPWKPSTDANVGVVSVESVIALGQAFASKRPPVAKLLTVIDKDNRPVGVRVRVGTPVRHILEALRIELSNGDRLVFGGPMTGRGVYADSEPIGPDTDAVMVQDRTRLISPSSDPCINCGECVRVCPAGVPVNMLIRLLENRLYEEAAQQYDLLSCVECGLCSYVCIMGIPIFHYIMLGKHELALTGYLEKFHG